MNEKKLKIVEIRLYSDPFERELYIKCIDEENRRYSIKIASEFLSDIKALFNLLKEGGIPGEHYWTMHYDSYGPIWS
jgi:hypothetical protein